MKDISFSIIVAIDLKNGIALNHEIPFYFKDDVANFRKMTLHQVVIMGRKTWESLPKPPLPFRTNIILSNTLKLMIPLFDVEIVRDWEELIQLLQQKYANKKKYIIGGESLYKQMINNPLCSELIITRINEDYHCDQFFPDFSAWNLNQILLKTKDFQIEIYSHKEHTNKKEIKPLIIIDLQKQKEIEIYSQKMEELQKQKEELMKLVKLKDEEWIKLKALRSAVKFNELLKK